MTSKPLFLDSSILFHLPPGTVPHAFGLFGLGTVPNHGPGIDEPLTMERDLDLNGSLETTLYYLQDGLGSGTALTDSLLKRRHP